MRILVTGSSRLEVYRRGGDSLMGRYFSYRMHPFTVGELCRTAIPAALPNEPSRVTDRDWKALVDHGGTHAASPART